SEDQVDNTVWMESAFVTIIECLQNLDESQSNEQLIADILSIDAVLPKQLKNISIEEWDAFLDAKKTQFSGRYKCDVHDNVNDDNINNNINNNNTKKSKHDSKAINLASKIQGRNLKEVIEYSR